MATKFYFVGSDSDGSGGFGDNLANLAGSNVGWSFYPLGAGQNFGGGGPIDYTASTVAGPTSGIEVAAAGRQSALFVSATIISAVTISGTMTFNIWAHESNAAANATVRVIVKRVNAKMEIVSTIVDSSFGTELGTSTAARNWTATPTSTNMAVGDRFVAFIATDDATSLTMASGHTVTVKLLATSDGGTGDSWIQFNETVGYFNAASPPFPETLNYYLRTTAADAEITTGSTTKKAMSTVKGSSQTTHATSTASGWLSPFQATDGAGTPIEWFTPNLAAATLSNGFVWSCTPYMSESNLAANAGFMVEIAQVDADGSNENVLQRQWIGGVTGEVTTAIQSYVTFRNVAPSTTLTDRQRIRLRVYFDDSGENAMVTGHTASLTYNATSPTTGQWDFNMGATGLAEYVASAFVPQIWRYH